jgi:hypothetical protein
MDLTSFVIETFLLKFKEFQYENTKFEVLADCTNNVLADLLLSNADSISKGLWLLI